MGERALGWGLRLLGIALLVGPFIAAFAAHGWDLKETVMPSEDEINRVKDRIENMFKGEISENMMNFTDNTVNLITGQFSVTVEFTSPFNLDVKITDISVGEVSCKQHGVLLAGNIQMEEQGVNLPANETATLTLVGALTPEGILDIGINHLGSLPDVTPTEASVELEFYGITVRVENFWRAEG